MDVDYCTNLFNRLQQDSRLEAISWIMDTLESKDLEMVLVIIERQLDNVDQSAIKVTEKNREFNENTFKNPQDAKNKLVDTDKCNISFLNYLEANVAREVPKNKEKTEFEERKTTCSLNEKMYKSFSNSFNKDVNTLKNTKRYSCYICAKSFNHKGGLNRHMICHTKEKSYLCSICQKSFSQRSNGDNHVKLKHPLSYEKNKYIIKKPSNNEYIVSQSEPVEMILSTKNKPTEGDDYLEANVAKEVPKNKDKTKFKSTSSLNEEMLYSFSNNGNCHAKKKHPVDYQKKKYVIKKPSNNESICIVSQSEPAEIILSTTNKSKEGDDYNEQVTNKKQKVGRPIKLNKALQECSYCKKKFKHKWHLQRHLKRHLKHDGNFVEAVLKCSFCDKTFQHKWLLEYHESSHVNVIKRERPSNLRSLSPDKGNCDPGNNMDKGRNSGKQSIIHQDKLAHSCDFCEKRFQRADHLRNHRRRHTGEKPFKCNKCDWSGRTDSSYSHHMKRNDHIFHKDNLAHSCDFCEKWFRRADHLRNHRRRHTGEKPFKCTKCDWSGRTDSSFSYHKKMHS